MTLCRFQRQRRRYQQLQWYSSLVFLYMPGRTLIFIPSTTHPLTPPPRPQKTVSTMRSHRADIYYDSCSAAIAAAAASGEINVVESRAGVSSSSYRCMQMTLPGRPLTIDGRGRSINSGVTVLCCLGCRLPDRCFVLCNTNARVARHFGHHDAAGYVCVCIHHFG